ncbi:acetylserotonin O-methyltransferase [Cognatishimia sp. MH4019]|uniref:acetylserotonin O-methyltransferase n=1 Tax=Cognatishimia sp. MH4019 TaxID=2854030 RepID=UPI001CD1B903|nr:acetylserotonin O-methyltransferase [Cognatishimia sp. MH4019]
MADIAQPPALPKPKASLTGWRNRLVASRGFQKWAAWFPLTRGKARRDGEAMFDLVAGFVHSQTLMALVELGVLDALLQRPLSTAELAARARVPENRMGVLLRAGAALHLLANKRGTHFLTQKGAALIGVPGLAQMIKHHRVLYRDLENPAAFMRGETETELAGFWPYVFGAGAAEDPDTAQTYSDLMAQSQQLVAEDTLRMVSFKDSAHLLDIGGGTGAFLAEVGAAYPKLPVTLFDLPAVVPEARARFEAAGMAARSTITPGSFREDVLPGGADTISLIRVLYDHADDTVADLVSKCFDTLPDGGRLVISEPMLGSRAGDVYFAFYTLAMRTGRARSAAEIADICAKAGFSKIDTPKAPRPFVTSAVVATKAA